MRGEKRKRTPSRADGIHPRNKYRVPPDFKALAEAYPALRTYTVTLPLGGVNVQWNKPHALRELTKALLHRDFGLTWDMPATNLCPTLTNRLNYVHWIEDLLLLSRKSFVSRADEPAIAGIDVGTGASCIYPLLGHRLNQWQFVATDIDAASIACARANVATNGLEDAIRLELVSPEVVFPAPPPHCLFSMCNPPFFDSMDEADANPRADCTGALNEMTTPGGEVAFIRRMIDASLGLTTQVRWYTSLVGRKGSLRPLLAALRAAGIRNMRTTEFLQGRTTRWGIAWSFTSDGLDAPDSAAHKVLAKRKEAHRRNSMAFAVPRVRPTQEATVGHGCMDVDQLCARILESSRHVPGTVRCKSTQWRVNLRQAQGTLVVKPATSDDSTSFDLTYSAEGGSWLATAAVNETEDNYEVTLQWKEGKRDLFWLIADKWKAAIVRTSRAWRRPPRDTSSQV
ncbi:methyltransferase METT10D [Achlya hypogyna]|uniref:Methyltransferase METT10D n=1 Tax=Achlya hypogyna TaxID=1202772 RepID=A0A1V9YMW2_ACHHY|nr:methyltransferase METT10D [Achlya hypogyna]